MSVDVAAVERNVASVRARIDRAGGEGRVRLVAVTKGFGADAVRAALAAGVDDIGESYLQEMHDKIVEIEQASPPNDAASVVRPRWHVIGRLQRNKVRLVAPHVHLWHSVDRRELGVEIAKRAPGAAVLVQVNISNEPQKGGCGIGAAAALVETLQGLGLNVRGLMAVGPKAEPPAVRSGFRQLANLARQLDLDELSMGMSSDLEIAIDEGATLVRVGRDLFGERSSAHTAHARATPATRFPA